MRKEELGSMKKSMTEEWDDQDTIKMEPMSPFAGSTMKVEAEARDTLLEQAQLTHVWLTSMGRVPRLEALSRDNIQHFCKKYEAYVALVGGQVAHRPQLLVDSDILEVMAVRSGLDIPALCALPYKSFEEKLCKLVAARGYAELEQGFKHLSMRGDELSTSAILRYNQDWRFMLKVNKSQPWFGEEFLKKAYLEGLKPISLHQRVKRRGPKTVEEAMGLARDMVEDVKALKMEAQSLFPSGTSGNGNRAQGGK